MALHRAGRAWTWIAAAHQPCTFRIGSYGHALKNQLVQKGVWAREVFQRHCVGNGIIWIHIATTMKKRTWLGHAWEVVQAQYIPSTIHSKGFHWKARFSKKNWWIRPGLGVRSLDDVLNTPTVALALRISCRPLFHWTMFVIWPCAFSCRPCFIGWYFKYPYSSTGLAH